VSAERHVTASRGEQPQRCLDGRRVAEPKQTTVDPDAAVSLQGLERVSNHPLYPLRETAVAGCLIVNHSAGPLPCACPLTCHLS